MTATISDVLRDAGRDIAAHGAHDLAARLNAVLGCVLSGFYVGPGVMIDVTGIRSAPLECLISTARPDVGGLVPADSVACVAHLSTSLNRTLLADAFARIADVRRLRKTPSAEDARSTITLGLIVAADSTLELDEIATEMRSLNASVGGGERPDMLAVLTKGTVHYGVSLPGDDSVAGFLPPVQGTAVVPPINVRQLLTETATHALNKVCGFVIGHAAFYAPAVPRPDMRAATVGSPEQSTIVWTYRFDAAGKMSDAAKTADPIAPAYRIEDPKGELLCRLRYQPWQDGGVVIAEGALQLEGLLPLAGRTFPTMVFPLKNGHHISCVLPLDDRGFIQMMGEIARRISGMTLRQEQPQFTVVPLLDEGTESPFAARLYMTPPMLRDQAFTDKTKIARFDELFQFVMNHLVDVRKTSKAMLELWRTYATRVASGEIARYTNHIQIDESIDRPLNQHIKSLVIDAARVSKQFQNLTSLFGVNIGFLFQRDNQFAKGLAMLEATDPVLARYIRECRKWLEPLRLFRDELEHDNYVPPRMMYDRAPDGSIGAREPLFLGGRLTTTVPWIENSLNRFVEEILVWCVARAVQPPMIVTEIPIAARDPSRVERFRVTLAGSAPAWELSYSAAAFDEV